ncbi:MAG: hypothetical protein OXF31_13430 [Gammaproteobacteria bacterium]|nr:hypothetical protein [Gammaproteobacteria bacterium]
MAVGKNSWADQKIYDRDPLPEIAPALLNSVDIARYVEEGCLLEQKKFHRDRLKPASYEMRFLGDLYDWEKTGKRLKPRRRLVNPGDRVMLHKNSISYLWMEEQLLLPEYIAARFNLRIKEVHKGILLGTGPLIDPGFGGRILIPLHNLTDNDYEIKGGDGIIWVEFTKVSCNKYWSPSDASNDRPTTLIKFPSEKVIDSPCGYLGKAGVTDQGGVQSAFKGVLERVQSQSNKSRKKIRKLKRWGIGGSIVGLIGLAGLLISAYQLVFPLAHKVHEQSERIRELEIRVESLLEAQSTDMAPSANDADYIRENVTREGMTQPVDSLQNPPKPE